MTKKITASDMVGGISIDTGNDAAQTQAAAVVRLERPVKMVPVDAIVSISPTQSRVITFDPEKSSEDAELLASIQRHGVIEPVWVKGISFDPLGVPLQYMQVAGHRRVAAARAAGLKFVPAIVAKKDDDVASITIAENVGVKPLSGYERAVGILQLVSEHPETMNSASEISKATGVPQPSVYMLRDALDSPAALVQIFKNGKGARTIQSMKPIFSVVDAAEHERLAELMSDASHSQVERIADLVKSGQDAFLAVNLVLSAVPIPAPENLSETPSESEGTKTGKKASGSGSLGEAERAAIAGSLVDLSGVSPEVAQRLVAEFSGSLSPDVMRAACIYLSRGGEYEHAVKMASQLMASPSGLAWTKKYLAVVEKAKSLLPKMQAESPDLAAFLQKIA